MRASNCPQVAKVVRRQPHSCPRRLRRHNTIGTHSAMFSYRREYYNRFIFSWLTVLPHSSLSIVGKSFPLPTDVLAAAASSWLR